MTYRPLIKIRFSELFLEWIRIKYVKIQQLCKLIKICSFKTFFFSKIGGTVPMMPNKHSVLRCLQEQQPYLAYFCVPCAQRTWWRGRGRMRTKVLQQNEVVRRRNSKMGICINMRFLHCLYPRPWDAFV